MRLLFRSTICARLDPVARSVRHAPNRIQTRPRFLFGEFCTGHLLEKLSLEKQQFNRRPNVTGEKSKTPAGVSQNNNDESGFILWGDSPSTVPPAGGFVKKDGSLIAIM